LVEEVGAKRDVLAIDADRLARYLAPRLDGFGESLRVTKFSGGQSNPTYLLESGTRRLVLRKQPPGPLLPTAHAIDREHRVYRALYGSEVPVPKPWLYCDDPSVIGTGFFVMEHCEGRIFWDSTLPGLAASERGAIHSEMNRVLAALHRLDYAARGLGDFGKPGNYFARQVKRWTQQYESAKSSEIASMERLIRWLPANLPEDDDTCLVHGDFRLDNMIFHPKEPRVIALLDWEISTLGHPLADLAYNCMPYYSTFRAPVPLSQIAGADSGIPSEQQYVAEYCARVGRTTIPDLRFHLAFSFFRSAAITQGVYKRGLQGNASSADDASKMRERALQAAAIGESFLPR